MSAAGRPVCNCSAASTTRAGWRQARRPLGQGTQGSVGGQGIERFQQGEMEDSGQRWSHLALQIRHRRGRTGRQQHQTWRSAGLGRGGSDS